MKHGTKKIIKSKNVDELYRSVGQLDLFLIWGGPEMFYLATFDNVDEYQNFEKKRKSKQLLKDMAKDKPKKDKPKKGIDNK